MNKKPKVKLKRMRHSGKRMGYAQTFIDDHVGILKSKMRKNHTNNGLPTVAEIIARNKKHNS